MSAQEEDEAEDSADRLVIDESSEVLDGRGRGDNSSDAGDEVPQCQGCNQKSALFVCAGCGNQWYCSRDCQVSDSLVRSSANSSLCRCPHGTNTLKFALVKIQIRYFYTCMVTKLCVL